MPNEEESKIDAVVHEIQRRIREGRYVAYQPLPSERELVEELGVSRVTVRAAFVRLQVDNAVIIVPRAGAFVRPASPRVTIAYPYPTGISHPAEAMIEALKSKGRHTQVRVLEPPALIQIGQERGTKMQLPAETTVRRHAYLHLIEGVPYRLLESYTPMLAAEREQHANGSLGQGTGPRATRAVEHLACRMPTAREAALLNIARGQPVIEWERWAWANGESPVEYTVLIANAALHDWTWVYELEPCGASSQVGTLREDAPL